MCAHPEGIGHRGVDGTMSRLERHSVWDRGKTLPQFMVGYYVLVARVSTQGKHRKLMSTWTGPWRVANDDKEHVYAVQHLLTAELRDVTVARMRFTPMTSSRSSASSARFSNNWRTRASTTSGTSLLSSGLQAATSSLSRWPGKDWRRRREPGSLTVLRKEPKAWLVEAEQDRAIVQRCGLRLSFYILFLGRG